jgi:L-seryl-tRNA(Ser) seleniumtransferase
VKKDLLKSLPQIDALLRREDVRSAGSGLGDEALASLVRDTVADVRRGVLGGSLNPAQVRERLERLPEELRGRIAALSSSRFVPVLNATGVIVHTNLGRAPLPAGALARVAEAASGYATLEFDLALGARGSRGDHLARAAAALFPGQALHAVNNAAAALLLALNSLSDRREVLISRGELIEIGGSFRIPEILARSGAVLREVGTTNRTRLEDYREAIGGRTGLILKVHPSNYRIVGFTSGASIPELARLGREAGLPLVVDQGSGCLADMTPFGIPDEPTVSQLLSEGAGLVLFSGDKLLGGPQAGLLVGAPDLVARCRSNHLSRALRLDKMSLAALEWVLQRHAAGRAFEEIPVLAMLSASKDDLAARARRLRARLIALRVPGLHVDLLDGVSVLGGGAAPLVELPTRLLAVACDGITPETLEEALRQGDPPVIARLSEGRLLLDPRTLLPGQDAQLASAIARAAQNPG